ncbi:hypothetical protein Mrose_01437 [Calidithermus roseus]|uniref:Uncharacterized protein n=1 Tax=Calidithermus roseus TaxID=1644118 RepID=A0A399EU85_9DEIN|nr:hypothetical protein Mrose_01437 [Calidithermus roseus]
MHEQTMWMLARERQRELCAEVCRLRGVPRPEKGFWAVLLGKLSFTRARVQSTLTRGTCCVEAACCVA